VLTAACAYRHDEDVHLSTPNVADENGSLAREDVLYEDQLK
jgi:hypothetical protein